MVDFLVWVLKGGREGGTQLDRGDGAGGGGSVLGGGGEVHPICPLFQDGLSWG